MKKSQFAFILISVCFLLPLVERGFSADTGYLVGPGDVLKITVYDHPDLTTTARVDNEGMITFPLVGEVEIGGRSAAIASQIIAARLNGDYIVNPQVSVFIEEFRSRKVVIIGEVVRPGIFELSGPTSLLELISKAGGLTKGAGRNVTVHRSMTPVEGQPNSIVVDLGELLEASHSSVDVPLMDGDTVTVAKAGLVYVTGQVNRPAAYSYEPDMTVIKAITMAGGFTPLAAEGRIKIIRKVEGMEQVLERVSLHEKLAADDVMVIPESFF